MNLRKYAEIRARYAVETRVVDRGGVMAWWVNGWGWDVVAHSSRAASRSDIYVNSARYAEATARSAESSSATSDPGEG